MTSDTVTFERRDSVALIRLDDGKANALSPRVLSALNAALDRAEAEGVGAVVLSGRPGMLSGGFDLSVMRSGDLAAIGALVAAGGEFILRLYQSPVPIVTACTGHAVAAGALMLLGSHFRVGAEGPFRIVLNETTIGLVLPDWGIELSALRLSAGQVQQAAIESRVYEPFEARDAGFLDRVVPADAALATALDEAVRLAALPAAAYAGNAAKVRGPGIARVATAVSRDREALAGLGDAMDAST